MAIHGHTIRDELREDGYSKEEEYFHRLNRELIERREGPPQLGRPESNRSSQETQSRSGRVFSIFKRFVGRLLKGDVSWRP